MSKRILILLLITASAAICSFKGVDINSLFKRPDGWPRPQYDFRSSPLTPQKVALGRKLFFDPLLSRDGTISCASCHLPQTAFTHVDHDLSHGIGGKIGVRNSPALMNLAWSKSFMWDGSIHHLDVQALAPIENPAEMDEKIANVVKKLSGNDGYKTMFESAFGPGDITGQHTLQALSQFMLTFVSANAKYDKVRRGETAFNEYEARGYELFKANCSSCHREPLFTNDAFENNGLPVDTTLNDIGRMKVTHDEADRGKFKVPSLRNVEVTYPYMHDGRFKSLQMVLFHYTNGIEHSATLSPQLRKTISLSEDDKRNLIAFLRALTDEDFLHNEAYQPPTLKQDNP